jgi:hypothetical protein
MIFCSSICPVPGQVPVVLIIKDFLQEKAVEATKQEKERKEEKT